MTQFAGTALSMVYYSSNCHISPSNYYQDDRWLGEVRVLGNASHNFGPKGRNASVLHSLQLPLRPLTHCSTSATLTFPILPLPLPSTFSRSSTHSRAAWRRLHHLPPESGFPRLEFVTGDGSSLIEGFNRETDNVSGQARGSNLGSPAIRHPVGFLGTHAKRLMSSGRET
jgi:hypothetical protein